MNFIEIQSWPEIPSIGYFVSLFSQAFNLPEFPDIEDLEEALLLDSSENNDDSLRLIPELIVSLLRGCDLVEKPCQHITTSNYQMFLRRLFRYKCEEFKIENPFNTDTDFHILPLRTKAAILYLLCEFRLDSADVETKTSKLGADNLRIHPLGYDSNDSVYWYFYGTRLYREDLKSKVKNSGSASHQNRVWQVICFTEQDWVELANKFKNSKSRKESALYKSLDEDFLPSIPLLFKAKEAEHRRRLFQKRSSLRVNSILERRREQQLVEEEKNKQQEESARQKIEEKIRNDRANRANRRSSSISSSYSLSIGTSCELQSQLDFDSAYETTDRAFSSNKENILDFEETTDVMKTKKPANAPALTKLPGRQTNNSLSSITGQIIINSTASTSTSTTTVPVVTPQSRKKKPKADDFMDSDEVLNIGMHKVLMTLKNHDDAWPFVDPVEEEIAPRYYSIIKRPMDLLKMEEKLDSGEYRTFSEFKTDFKLIVNNCRLYNGQNNEYTAMVNNLQIAFDRGRRKYFDQSSSDEEQVLLEYPPIDSSNRGNVSKAKDMKVEKSKQQKERKIVQSEDESENEQKNEKPKHKKVKNLKNKQEPKETEKKSEKTTNSDESKKSKSTKGIKRKSSKPKEHVKSKKMKKEIDNESENNSESEDEKEEQKSVDVVKSKDKEKDKKKKKSVLKQKNVKTNKIENSLNDKKNGSKKSSHHVNEKGSKVSKKSKNDVVEKSFHESSDDDDSNSVRDLIEEKVEKKPETSKKQKKSSDQHHSSKAEKKPKRMSAESLDNHKNGSKKSKKQNKKLSKENDLPSSPTSSRSSSPLLTSSAGIVDDFNNSFDSSDRRFDNLLRSETPEIKDKFDLIKERRNRMNQQKQKDQKVPKPKNPSTSSHIEKHKSKDKPVKVKPEKIKKSLESETPPKSGAKPKDKEENSLFDKLKNEELEDKKKVVDNNKGHSKKSKVKSEDKKESKSSGSHKTKEEVKDGKHHLSKSKKQNRASLDVLDMETEQTLKDINKWLEHTPRFEYSSASNSPSRYVIDELDMPSKLDDDFRKPIPLMPSSPSASQTNFHSPKDLNLLKESNNNNKNTSSLNQLSGNSKKNNNKETKRKNSRDKLLQNVPKKKEVQRTIDRLQPGKTKGNLLNNIQNINKPDEIYPLGSREKLKEVKNSLFVETDDSSPKLSLGTVLDNQSFNLIDCEKINKSEKFGSLENEDDTNELKSDCPSPKKVDDLETLTTEEELTESASTTKTENSSKPNLVNTNAWFKAFGAPKKPKKLEEDLKVKENEGMNPEGNYIPSQTRRLSTGSSISERSSESSPHVGIDERGAPAPYPSPIGTSPMPSPRIDDTSKPSSSSYGVNGSTRVGFYQDMTSSIKSSPEKSCSPRETPYSQYSQQSHYSGTSPATTSPHYGSFYPENPSPGHPNQQASYSKPTHSPAPYYDQYKQPMSQESDFNNSMSPNTNPNSPYHSQQSSPYQQQPNSPFQSANTISPNNQNLANTSTSYTQPSSPYHQQQPAVVQKAQPSQFVQSPNSPNNIQKVQISEPIPTFPSQPPLYQQQQHVLTNTFDQSHRPAQEQQYQPPAQKPEWNSTQQSAAYVSQQQPIPPINTQSIATTQVPPNQISQEIYSQSQDYNTKKKTLNDLENAAARVYAESNKSVELPNPAYPTAVEKVKDTTDIIDNNKYLDLSKQVPPAVVASHPQHPTQPMNQYQQMFDLSNYSKHGMDYELSKAKSAEAYSRPAVDKSHVPMPPSAPGFWGNNKSESSEHNAIQAEHAKADMTGKVNTSFAPTMPPHQQVARGTTIDPNYKPPIFNNPAASSMMDLTAFMRDFRHPDERFSTLPGTPGSFYDKNIPPAHMFSKNLPQTATSAALQQMFNNSMNTMSYSRDQQSNSHNRWNTPQGTMTNLNPPSVATSAPVAPEITKPKKGRKSKKNASPEPTATLHPNYQSQAANQYQQQHPHHQQPISHQQPPFQSYGGLKISSNSADTLKAVGSAFNYGPAPTLTGLYGDNSAAYLDDFRNAAAASNPYYPPPPGLAHRSTPDTQHDKTGVNPPAAHPQAPAASPYHHLLPAHHPSRSSYPFMNSLDPATLQQQYRMMLNQTYQGYHPALSMHNQWPHHM